MGAIESRRIVMGGAAALVVCAGVAIGCTTSAGAQVAPLAPSSAGGGASAAPGDVRIVSGGKRDQLEAILREVPRRGPAPDPIDLAPPLDGDEGTSRSVAAQVAVGVAAIGYAVRRRRGSVPAAP